MKHYFEVNVAKEVGVNAAIVYENIAFWVKHNANQGKNLREGVHWMYATQKELSEQFDYLSIKQVRTALEKLEEHEYIKTGSFNRHGYDRTTWYTITEKAESICPKGEEHLPSEANDEPKKAIGFDLVGATIPYIKKDNKTGEQYLIPLSFYVAGACEKVCVVGKGSDGATLWSQPLLIMQNRYPSAMVNSWDGNLNVGGIDKGTIFAPRFVAGKKETDNTFSGVMLGNWSDTVSDNSLTQGDTGIYGYDNGEQSYAFKQDGTAFIGKSGTGRIKFDGTTGIIESGTYKAGQGMSINLGAGTIDAHTFTLTAGTLTNDNSAVAAGVDKTILIDTTADQTTGFPLQVGSKFKVDWFGNLKATNAVFDGNGEFHGTIYATGGELGNLTVTGTLTGGTIKGSTITNGSSFSVTAAGAVTCSDITVTGGSIAIGNNFSVDTSGNLTAAGNAKITGTIEANAGRIGGWTIEYSEGTPDNVRGWNALYSKFLNPKDEEYYAFFDPSRDFPIAIGIPSAWFQRDHGYAAFKVQYDGSFSVGGKYPTFKVTAGGALDATAGTIAGWKITENGFSSGDFVLNKTGTFTGGITIDSLKVTGSSSFGGTVTVSGTLKNSSGTWSLSSSGYSTTGSISCAGLTIGTTTYALTSTSVVTNVKIKNTYKNVEGNCTVDLETGKGTFKSTGTFAWYTTITQTKASLKYLGVNEGSSDSTSSDQP